MFSASTGYVQDDETDDDHHGPAIHLKRLVDTKLVVVTGKGGTGRTTVAAALGLAAAATGRRAIVCEVAGQARVPSVLGTRSREARRWRRDAQGYDTVILDAPASGHGLGLLRTPRTFADIARIGPIAGQARAVDEALTDPGRTAVVAVALPGELAVSETLELEDRIAQRVGRGLSAIVVNAVWPRRISGAEAERVAAADGALNAALQHAARAGSERVRTQQGQLARLRREASAAVHTLPFVFADRLESEQIRAFSARLAKV
jgi:anion-transporting  ArsA/GET3 family ATPase